MARPRIVIVGGGFAGVRCARHLERMLPPPAAELVLVSPFNYMLHRPLLPQVASGVLSPQSIAVPLRRLLRRTQVVPGAVMGVDLDARACVVATIAGAETEQRYERLVLAPGSVTRMPDIPGLDLYARGMRNLAEAMFLRDHVIAQLEVANASTDTAERLARLRFVVVGGGYAGVETAASLQLLTTAATRHFPRLNPAEIRWTLVDAADRLLPELGEASSGRAADFLLGRGVEIALRTGVAEAGRDAVRLTDGRTLRTHTLVWTPGVTPNPLMAALGAETAGGRLVVGADLAVPGRPDVFALGDAAAVPDLSRADGAVCAATAQHAHRQALVAGANVVASLRGDPAVEYLHKDLGLVLDLGGPHAVARPGGIDLSGPAAQLVTRGYRLSTVPSATNKARVLANWVIHALAGDDFTRLGFLDGRTGAIGEFESSRAYLTPQQAHEHVAAARG